MAGKLKSFHDQGLKYDACIRIRWLPSLAELIGSRHGPLKATKAIIRPCIYKQKILGAFDEGPSLVDAMFEKPIVRNGIEYQKQKEVRVLFLPIAQRDSLPDITHYVNRSLKRHFEPVCIDNYLRQLGAYPPPLVPRLDHGIQCTAVKPCRRVS
jgi:hypothetical protein